MQLDKIAAELSEIENATLSALKGGKELQITDLAAETRLNIDSVRRAVEWLKEKGLIELKEQKKEAFNLTAAGKSSFSKGLPEKMFVETLRDLGGKASLEEIRKKSQLNVPEMNVAMGIAKRNAWVSIRKEGEKIILELTGLEKQILEGNYHLEILIKKIQNKEGVSEEKKEDTRELIRRGLAEEIESIERKAKINAAGEKALKLVSGVRERKYDVSATVPTIYIGKRQPYVQFLSKIRRRLVELGFKEMYSPLITQEFYNFDILFQPQNHPARSWADTYQLKNPSKGVLPSKKVVAGVKAAHEHGGRTGSIGWRYEWSEEIAKKLMPSAHGTAHSARQLVSGVEVPGKYFAIARCYRPDVMDANHLIEFNQMEGFIVGEELNFRHLLGMLKDFAIEIAGAEKVKFYPDYYPFTEPSVQLSALHPKMGWIEFAGAGVFRPEMMLPLGIKETAIAWGLGIDRLAMFMLDIKDMRQLFSTDLDWLRKQGMVK